MPVFNKMLKRGVESAKRAHEIALRQARRAKARAKGGATDDLGKKKGKSTDDSTTTASTKRVKSLGSASTDDPYSPVKPKGYALGASVCVNLHQNVRAAAARVWYVEAHGRRLGAVCVCCVQHA